MKRDLTSSSRRCHRSRVRFSTVVSIVGIALVISSLTWIEDSGSLKNQPTLSLLQVTSKTDANRREVFEVWLAPELFGNDARIGLPIRGSYERPTRSVVAPLTRPLRLASMEKSGPRRERTRKS